MRRASMDPRCSAGRQSKQSGQGSRGVFLALESGVVELDRERKFETFEGLEARPLVAVPYFDRALDSEKTLGRGLLLDARRLNEKHERRGTPVHDRNFRPSEIDVGVVDAQA